MTKRHSVERWKKDAMQAASMRSGVCTEATGLIGIDMLARDGNAFAHGHFDVATAREFHKQLGDAIAEAGGTMN